jgi:hypothetical protein
MSLDGIAERSAFAPEDIQVITTAYHVIVESLNLRSPESREKAAKVVTEIAGSSIRLEIDRGRDAHF